MSGGLWLAISVIGLALAIGTLVWGCLKIRDWFRDDTGHADDPAMFLTALQESARQGDVTADEYRTIQGRLRGTLGGSTIVLPPSETTAESTDEGRDTIDSSGGNRPPEADSREPID